MTVFLDSSVLIAASDRMHEHFRPSRALYAAASRTTTLCAAHSFAEIYAVLTRLPKHGRRSPAEALLLLEEMRARVGAIALTPDEHFEAIANLVPRELSGGIVYDALLLRCARKAKADRIYTWNVRHFQAVASGLAERITTP